MKCITSNVERICFDMKLSIPLIWGQTTSVGWQRSAFRERKQPESADILQDGRRFGDLL